MRVAGIGQCSWDILAVVPRHPEADTKTDISGWHEEGGGPVATALVTLARLGVAASFAGVRGADSIGDQIAGSLAGEGIDTSSLLPRAGLSQHAFISVEKETGRRTIFCRRPTAAPLRYEELQEAFFDRLDFLLLDGTMPDAALPAAAECRRRGIPVMLDAGSLRPGILEMAKLSDYVVGPASFFTAIGWDGTEEGLSALASGVGDVTVTVTMGEQGSITCSGEIFRTPAFEVTAVDTTGAGDVFHGAYVYGLLRGWPLKATLRFASAAAALSCRSLGGRSGIPDFTELRDFLGRQKVTAEEGAWAF